MRLFNNRDWTIICLLILTSASMLVAANQWLDNYLQQGRTMRAVYAVCNESRQVINGKLEQACGDAQDKSSTEFMCDHNNQAPDTNCWVELK